MSKSGSKKNESLVDKVAAAAVERMDERIQERLGGMPAQDTQDNLDSDEIERPLTDTDFFDFCHHSFALKGEAIKYYVSKDGQYLTTLPHPTSWDEIRKKYGAGVYKVQCKSVSTGAFKKQQTQILAELPEEPVEEESQGSGFGFGMPQSGSSDFSAIIAMMNAQSERMEAQRREDREREREERRESRENFKNMLLSLAPIATPVVQALLTPKNKGSETELLLGFMRESTKTNQDQLKEMLTRIERMSESKKDTGPSTLELLEMQAKAEEKGERRAREMLEMVEERAEARAEEIAARSSGGEDESVTTMLIKTLGPALAQAFVQGKGLSAPQTAQSLPAPEAGESEEVVSNDEEAARIEAEQRAKEQAAMIAAQREKVIGIVSPDLVEALTQLGQGVKVDPAQVAKTSLGKLQAQGFTQPQVLDLFPKAMLDQMIRDYQLPNELKPWFNSYYAALSSRPTVQSRIKPVVRGSRPGVNVSRDSRAHAPASPAPESANGGAVVEASVIRSDGPGASEIANSPAH